MVRDSPHCIQIHAGSPHNKCPYVRYKWYTTLYKYMLGGNITNVHVLGEYDQSKATYFPFPFLLDMKDTLGVVHHSQFVTQGGANSLQMVTGWFYLC
jgi:hypothetical protein